MEPELAVCACHAGQGRNGRKFSALVIEVVAGENVRKKMNYLFTVVLFVSDLFHPFGAFVIFVISIHICNSPVAATTQSLIRLTKAAPAMALLFCFCKGRIWRVKLKKAATISIELSGAFFLSSAD
jgi:hypothetical protein